MVEVARAILMCVAALGALASAGWLIDSANGMVWGIFAASLLILLANARPS